MRCPNCGSRIELSTPMKRSEFQAIHAKAEKCDGLVKALRKIAGPYSVDGVACHWSANRMREIAEEALEATPMNEDLIDEDDDDSAFIGGL